MVAGYSGKSLSTKLGVKPNMQLIILNPPENYLKLLGVLPDDVKIINSLGAEVSFIQSFYTEQSQLILDLKLITRFLAKGGLWWVSWPKKASKVKTDITEDVLRELILPTGLVDVKVIAIDEVWSGLKFVWRKNLL